MLDERNKKKKPFILFIITLLVAFTALGIADEALNLGGGNNTINITNATSFFNITNVTYYNFTNFTVGINSSICSSSPEQYSRFIGYNATGYASFICANDNSGSSGVTSISQGEGIILSPNPIVATGTVSLNISYLNDTLEALNLSEFFYRNGSRQMTGNFDGGNNAISNVSDVTANRIITNNLTSFNTLNHVGYGTHFTTDANKPQCFEDLTLGRFTMTSEECNVKFFIEDVTSASYKWGSNVNNPVMSASSEVNNVGDLVYFQTSSVPNDRTTFLSTDTTKVKMQTTEVSSGNNAALEIYYNNGLFSVNGVPYILMGSDGLTEYNLAGAGDAFRCLDPNGLGVRSVTPCNPINIYNASYRTLTNNNFTDIDVSGNIVVTGDLIFNSTSCNIYNKNTFLQEFFCSDKNIGFYENKDGTYYIVTTDSMDRSMNIQVWNNSNVSRRTTMKFFEDYSYLNTTKFYVNGKLVSGHDERIAQLESNATGYQSNNNLSIITYDNSTYRNQNQFRNDSLFNLFSGLLDLFKSQWGNNTIMNNSIVDLQKNDSMDRFYLNQSFLKTSNISSCVLPQVLTTTDGKTLTCTTPASGGSPAWATKIIGTWGNGDPNMLMQLIQANTVIAPTPTSQTATVVRISYFVPDTSITVNTIRWFGIGEVSQIYRIAIYNDSKSIRLTPQYNITTIAGRWQSQTIAGGLTLNASERYFMAISVNTTGATPGLISFSTTSTAITNQMPLPKFGTGNLDVNKSYINRGFGQFATTVGLLPTTAPVRANQTTWTGGMPAFWLDNS